MVIAAEGGAVGATAAAARIDVDARAGGSIADAHSLRVRFDGENGQTSDGERTDLLYDALLLRHEVEVWWEVVVQGELNLTDADRQHLVDQMTPGGDVTCFEHVFQTNGPLSEDVEVLRKPVQPYAGAINGDENGAEVPEIVLDEVHQLLSKPNSDHVVMVELHEAMTAH